MRRTPCRKRSSRPSARCGGSGPDGGFILVLHDPASLLFQDGARRPAVVVESDPPPEILASASDEAGEQQVRLLEQGLARLSAEDRELITLKHLDGLSYRGSGRATGNPARHGDEPALSRAAAPACRGQPFASGTMNPMDCETVRQAAMALADGEIAPLNAAEVQAHLANARSAGAPCRTCDRSPAGGRAVAPPPTVDLWPRIEGRLAAEAAKRQVRQPGRQVRGARHATPARSGPWCSPPLNRWSGSSRLGALAFVLGWFILLRENPFTLQPHLIVAKENTP